jgi:hypothetical protein
MIKFDGAILNESNVAYAYVSYSDYSNKWVLHVQMMRGGDISFTYDSEAKANSHLDSLFDKIKVWR